MPRANVVPQRAAPIELGGSTRRARVVGRASGLASLGLAILLCGCATAPITQSGALASYAELTPSNGVLAKSLLHIDKDAVLAAKTVRISPAAFSPTAAPALSDDSASWSPTR